MATSALNPVIGQLRRVVLLPDGAGLTDGQLLESFVSQRDEAAFAVLVRRHGPMVLGVCRRVLRNHHDAEDAFQATFLVLVRKAASILPREMVANWLYGVAYRTALKARGLIARQRVRERQVTDMPEPEAVEPDDRWRELQPLLDQELSRLPDKYRVPLVLCDLEGKTGKETARQLGWPEGTVSSRLARGRTMLAKRLTRHGLALSGGSVAAVFSQNAASASVPPSLASSTLKAAHLLAAGQSMTAGLISANVVALTEGVLKAMSLNKLKIIVLLVVGIGVAGVGWGHYRALANDQPAGPGEPQQVAPVDGKQAKTLEPAKDKAGQPGKKNTDQKRSTPKNQANQILDMVLKGMQAYQDSKAKAKPLSDQDLAKLLWEMMKKSYKPPKGAKQPDKEAWDLYEQAFLTAFQIAHQVAKAKGKGHPPMRAEDQQALDAIRAAFLPAYERARTLKKVLEEEKALGGKRREKAVEALDLFLKAGKEFEQAVQQRANADAKKEIESALRKVERTAHDRRTALETLEEIEKAVKDLKKKIQRKGGK
jgi:RNA polymerase sigma factor (sigma-70 family)